MAMSTEQKDEIIAYYATFVNVIDDFFEYRYKNYDQIDVRDYVYRYMDDLTTKLDGIKSIES